MGPNPFLGVIFHWIGGFASATNFIPFRGIKRWSWEVYWLIQGFAAWIVAPIVIGSIFVPNLFGILRQSYAEHPKNVLFALLFGMLWGVGGITFGLAIRYLGIALGYAIALGLCAAFGTVVPPIFHGQILTIMSQNSGQFILLGVAVCIIGVAVNGAAGVSKDQEFTPEEKAEAGETDFDFRKGLAIAVLAGFMSSFFAFGLDAGKPIGDLTKTLLLADGRMDLWQNLPILVVVLWGGFDDGPSESDRIAWVRGSDLAGFLAQRPPKLTDELVERAACALRPATLHYQHGFARHGQLGRIDGVVHLRIVFKHIRPAPVLQQVR